MARKVAATPPPAPKKAKKVIKKAAKVAPAPKKKVVSFAQAKDVPQVEKKQEKEDINVIQEGREIDRDPIGTIFTFELLDYQERCLENRSVGEILDKCHDRIEEVGNKFSCLICLGFLRRPTKCALCEVYFCTECLTNYLDTNDVCPHCSKDMEEGVNLTRKEIEFYNEALVTGCPHEECPLNRKEMKYETLIGHLEKDCSAVKLLCCYDDCKALLVKEGLEQHLKVDCKNKKTIICPHCDDEMSYKQLQEHYCNGLVRLLYAACKAENE